MARCIGETLIGLLDQVLERRSGEVTQIYLMKISFCQIDLTLVNDYEKAKFPLHVAIAKANVVRHILGFCIEFNLGVNRNTLETRVQPLLQKTRDHSKEARRHQRQLGW